MQCESKERPHNDTAVGKRRIMLAKMLLFLTLLVFATELAAFFFFHPYSLLTGTMSKNEYMLFYVALPSTWNLIISGFCFWYQRSKFVSEKKNLVLVTAASLMCLNICFYHDTIFATLGTFCVPVMISTLFGNRKLAGYTCILNGSFLILLLLHSFNGTIELIHMFMLNAIVALVLFFSVYLLSTVLIDYNREIQERILQDYQVQQVLKKEINSDSLTKLNNQNAYRVYMEVALQEHLLKGRPVLLAILDIDDFKKVNDTYGHSAGNEVLVSLANALRSCFCEEQEFTARYGGEEFVIVFRHGDWKSAIAKIEAFRIAFSEMQPQLLEGNAITFSVGVAITVWNDQSVKQLFDRADAALYRAKGQGKNRTVFFAEEMIKSKG